MLVRNGSLHASTPPAPPFNSTNFSIANTTVTPFTAANVFGIFITLQFCQLTQPSGFLLIPSPTGWAWRCSPVACFVEGCMILVYLVSQHRESWLKIRGFRVVAAALLLARSGIVQITDTQFIHSRFPSVGRAREDPETRDQVNATHFTIDMIASLPPKPGRIALFTNVSVTLVFIKVWTVRGVPWFTTAMTGLIFGWLMVQILPMLVGQPHFTEQDKEEIIERAKNIANDSTVQMLWLATFFVGHIYIVAYGSWLIAFTIPLFSSDSVGIVHTYIFEAFCIVLGLFSAGYVIVMWVMGLYSRAERIFYSPIVLGALCATFVIISLHTGNESQVTQRLYNTSRSMLRVFYLIAIYALVYLSFFFLSIFVPYGGVTFNLIFTGTTLCIYLVWYDSTGTVNPGWLDWLG